MLAMVVFLGFQARNFRLDASAETLVIENDEDLRYSRLMNSRYGQSDFLVLTFTPKDDLFSDKTLATMGRLKERLISLERVSSVLSILDVPLLESPPLSLKELTSELPTLESPKTDRKLARIELSASPLYRNLLLSPDSKTTALLVKFTDDGVYHDLLGHRNELRRKQDSGPLTPAEQIELKEATERFRQYRDQWKRLRHQDIITVRTIMDDFRSEADLFLGGVSMIADDMITFIKNDLKVFGLGVLLFIIIMLGVIFRRWRWIFLPMLCCLVSVIVMIGLLGWFGWEVTVISSNFISLQLIITMALAIHLIVRYRELLSQNPEASNRQLILDTIRLKLKPCVFTVLTTIAGFGSLVLCRILPVVMFGWMMIMGLVVSLIVTFLLFPAVLVLMPKDKPHVRLAMRFTLTPTLARFTQAHGAAVIVISALVFIAGFVGISQLRVENSFIDYFDKNTEIYRGMRTIDQQLGGTTPLDVIIDFDGPTAPAQTTENTSAESDDIFDEFDELDQDANDPKYWFTAEKISQIKAVHEYLYSLPETGNVLSLANIVGVAEKLNKGKPLDSLELALLYSETPDEFKTTLVRPYVSVEHSQTRFWVRARDSDKNLRRNELLKKIRRDLTDKLGIDEQRVHLAGMLVLYNNMLQSLFGSQILTLGVTMLLLMVMFVLLLRSLKLALIAMVPNMLPVAAVLGLMGWLGIPLDMMTITIAAIAMGIAVDNTIHYIHRFKDEFQANRDYKRTMHRCHGSIGYAMYYTSITIIVGFSILALSNFIPSVYFGLLTGFVMVVALLADLMLLPQLLIMAKPFGKES